MQHNIIYNTPCSFNTENTLNRDFYEYIHYTRGNYMGVWIPDITMEHCIACDVYAKMGKLNATFVKEVMAFHKNKHCYVTVRVNSLKARWLASSMGFEKVSSNDKFYCYYKEL